MKHASFSNPFSHGLWRLFGAGLVLFPSIAQSDNLWVDRQRALKSRSAAERTALRSLLPAVDGAWVERPSLPLPQTARDAAHVPVWLRSSIGRYGDVRTVDPPENFRGPVLIHIQDAHDVEEAQRNIAGLLNELRPLRPVVVGLEGASGSFDFAALRNIADAETTRLAADYMLRTHLITGAEYDGLTVGEPLPMVGVETPTLYESHLAALRSALSHRAEDRAVLDQWTTVFGKWEAALYSPALRDVQRVWREYEEGKQPVTAVAARLATGAPAQDLGPETWRLLEAHATEESIDLKRVDAERRRLVERLVPRLTEKGVADLTALALDTRLGRSPHNRFHDALKRYSTTHGLNWNDYPAYAAYEVSRVRFEKIDPMRLREELIVLAASRRQALATSPLVGSLLEASDDLRLLSSLSDFQLTPEDHRRLRERRGAINALPKRAQAFSAAAGTAASLPSLNALIERNDAFYLWANRRDHALAGNIFRRLLTPDAPQTSSLRLAVLVTGGYHAAGIQAQCRTRGVGYVGITPRLSAVPEPASWDAYRAGLSPAEKLWRGGADALNRPLHTASRPIGGAVRGVIAAVLLSVAGALASPAEAANNAPGTAFRAPAGYALGPVTWSGASAVFDMETPSGQRAVRVVTGDGVVKNVVFDRRDTLSNRLSSFWAQTRGVVGPALVTPFAPLTQKSATRLTQYVGDADTVTRDVLTFGFNRLRLFINMFAESGSLAGWIDKQMDDLALANAHRSIQPFLSAAPDRAGIQGKVFFQWAASAKVPWRPGWTKLVTETLSNLGAGAPSVELLPSRGDIPNGLRVELVVSGVKRTIDFGASKSLFPRLPGVPRPLFQADYGAALNAPLSVYLQQESALADEETLRLGLRSLVREMDALARNPEANLGEIFAATANPTDAAVMSLKRAQQRLMPRLQSFESAVAGRGTVYRVERKSPSERFHATRLTAQDAVSQVPDLLEGSLMRYLTPTDDLVNRRFDLASRMEGRGVVSPAVHAERLVSILARDQADALGAMERYLDIRGTQVLRRSLVKNRPAAVAALNDVARTLLVRVGRDVGLRDALFGSQSGRLPDDIFADLSRHLLSVFDDAGAPRVGDDALAAMGTLFRSSVEEGRGMLESIPMDALVKNTKNIRGVEAGVFHIQGPIGNSVGIRALLDNLEARAVPGETVNVFVPTVLLDGEEYRNVPDRDIRFNLQTELGQHLQGLQRTNPAKYDRISAALDAVVVKRASDYVVGDRVSFAKLLADQKNSRSGGLSEFDRVQLFTADESRFLRDAPRQTLVAWVIYLLDGMGAVRVGSSLEQELDIEAALRTHA